MKLEISISHGQCGAKDVPLLSDPGCYELREDLDHWSTISLNQIN